MKNPISQEMQAAFVIDDFSTMRKLIIDGADVNSVDARDGTTIMERAIANNDIEMVKFLIAHGVDLNKPGPRKMTPLHVAADLIFTEAGKLLLDAGAWVDPLDQHGATPLAYVISSRQEGFLEMAQLLISYGAKKEITNKEGVLLIDVYSKLYGDNVLKTL
ncbi:MAG: ankyrin repeat domain-containing protein [Proteobacteria bacterium]|nr:ankyrin repeat domain-containing protein [Pseudomonadota bacterium]MCL2309144.1 ankyrin repeat domain-containing protein [Pseudomonadota bacterium]